jgi:hypothetical protein
MEAAESEMQVCDKCGEAFRTQYAGMIDGEGILNAGHIARRMFREKHRQGDYLLRDIPKVIWQATKQGAAKQGVTVREYILLALDERNGGGCG